MRLVPLGDRVVLKQVVAEETTKSGIVLPGQTKEKPQQAEVVADKKTYNITCLQYIIRDFQFFFKSKP